MEYPKEFVNLVNSTTENLIGWGNPNAKILIVGKESAIDEKNIPQRNKEIVENRKQWEFNYHNNVDFNDVIELKFDESDKYYIEKYYNPLYPYKGQEFNVRHEFRNAEGFVYRVTGKNGTSSTWYNYQRLCNFILGRELFPKKNDFFKYFFATELSTATAKYSHDANKIAKEDSIKNRKKFLYHPFYQGFPIVVLAVGHYPRKHNIDIEALFQTRWNQHTCIVGKNWYNVHYSTTNNPKLLIHTNQLSMVSNDLIKEIADRCIEFKNKYNIEL